MAIVRTVTINNTTGKELELHNKSTLAKFCSAYDSELPISIDMRGKGMCNQFFIKFLKPERIFKERNLAKLLKIDLRGNPLLTKKEIIEDMINDEMKDEIKDGIKELADKLASSGIIEIHLSTAETDSLKYLIDKAAQCNRTISIYIDLTNEQFNEFKLVLLDKTNAIYTDTKNRVKIFNTSPTFHSTIINKDLRVAPLQPTDRKDQSRNLKNQITEAIDQRDKVIETAKMEYKTPETISAVAPITAPQLAEQKIPSTAEHGAGAGTSNICDGLNIPVSLLVKPALEICASIPTEAPIPTAENVVLASARTPLSIDAQLQELKQPSTDGTSVEHKPAKAQEPVQTVLTPEQPKKHPSPKAVDPIAQPGPSNEPLPRTVLQSSIDSLDESHFAADGDYFDEIHSFQILDVQDSIQSLPRNA